MTEEEKEAKLIEELKLEIEKLAKISTSPTGTYVTFEGLVTLLNIIQRKDKQIELMSDTILEDTFKLDTYWCNGCSKTIECPYENPKDCIKQYFERKVEE